LRALSPHCRGFLAFGVDVADRSLVRRTVPGNAASRGFATFWERGQNENVSGGVVSISVGAFTWTCFRFRRNGMVSSWHLVVVSSSHNSSSTGGGPGTDQTEEPDRWVARRGLS